MKRSYKKVITILNKLENIWDNDLILVADNSRLLLIHSREARQTANPKAMEIIRKVTAMGVAAMEQIDTAPRK
jgi:hypothetical protein